MTMQHYDLVMTGGRVVDPASGRDGAGEVAVSGGRIAAIAETLPPHRATKTVDAKGRIVCPGLIDLHVHVYEWVTNFGLPPDDAGVHSGATTIVDQGSAGPWTVGGFKAFIADPAETDVRTEGVKSATRSERRILLSRPGWRSRPADFTQAQGDGGAGSHPSQ